MGTPRERLLLAQNPLFRRILSAGLGVPSQRAARFPELTPRAPEGKTAPARRVPSQHARKSRSGRLETSLLNTPRRALALRCRVWSTYIREPATKTCLDPPRER